jgi:hypothetical protein
VASSSEILAVSAGVLFSHILFLISVDNPAQIPMRRIVIRAAFGSCMFVTVWAVLALVLLTILKGEVAAGRLQLDTGQLALRFLAGLVLPQASRLKDVLPPSIKWIHYATILFHWFDEVSRLYWGRIVDREERRATECILMDETLHPAIDKLYSFRCIDLAARVRKHAKRELTAEQILSILGTRYIPMKLRFLIRDGGCDECTVRLKKLAREIGSIFPDWPSTGRGGIDRRDNKVDRRAGGVCTATDRRDRPHGRRAYDSPYVREYVLGLY